MEGPYINVYQLKTSLPETVQRFRPKHGHIGALNI